MKGAGGKLASLTKIKGTRGKKGGGGIGCFLILYSTRQDLFMVILGYLVNIHNNFMIRYYNLHYKVKKLNMRG